MSPQDKRQDKQDDGSLSDIEFFEPTERTIVLENDKPKLAPKSEVPERGSPCFIVLTGKSVGKMYKLEPGEYVVGRSAQVDLVVDDPSISRSHAKVLWNEQGEIHIKDLESTNGTFINGKRASNGMIKDGDKIRLGETCILKFTYQDELEENFQKHLYESATKDHLTKIYNKKFFVERLQSEHTFARRHGTIFSLVIFDVDHFKAINDTHGHQVGDFVLHRLAEIITKIIRIEDVFARYGGEEFIILLRGIVEQRAQMFAERMRRTIEKSVFQYKGITIPVTVSVGVATHNERQYETADGMVEEADNHLYAAKRSGRNAVRGPLSPG